MKDLKYIILGVVVSVMAIFSLGRKLLTLDHSKVEKAQSGLQLRAAQNLLEGSSRGFDELKNRKLQWKSKSKRYHYDVLKAAKLQKDSEDKRSASLEKNAKAKNLKKKKNLKAGKGKLKKSKKIVKKGKVKPKAKSKDFGNISVESPNTVKYKNENENETERNAVGVQESQPIVGVPAALEKDADEKSTYEYWANQLLKTPSRTLMLEFLDNHTSKTISDQVFYTILREMLFSNRVGLQKLAFIGLNSQRSASGFLLLSEYVQEMGKGTELGSQAYKMMLSYNSIVDVRFLSSIITTESNEFAVIQAASLLNKIISKYSLVESKDPSNSTLSETEDKNYVLRDVDIAILQALIPQLEDALAKQKNQQVSSQIQLTMTTLVDLVGRDVAIL